MKDKFFIKRKGYYVERGPLKKNKIIPLNLKVRVEKHDLKALPPFKTLSYSSKYLPGCQVDEH